MSYSNPSDPCRCPDECRYWCPVHEEHHVVPGLVESCIEKATAPARLSEHSA